MNFKHGDALKLGRDDFKVKAFDPNALPLQVVVIDERGDECLLIKQWHNDDGWTLFDNVAPRHYAWDGTTFKRV